MGKGTAHFTGLRVGKNGVTYIPGYNKNGQTINACARISAFVNGKNERSDVFTFTAWGKLADIMAKSLSPGKEFHCDARPESYDGRVFDGNRNVMLKEDGTPLMTRKVSFRITGGVIFGAESNKQISDEIAAGKRPANWNVENHADQALWRQILAGRTALTYQGGDTYGYATVHKTSGTSLPAQVAGAAEGQSPAQAMAENVGQVVDQSQLY
jgi:hypothetical protein